MSIYSKVLNYYNNLEKNTVPENIEVLDPYCKDEVKKIQRDFYGRYFKDSKRRIIIFGINPGRFGGGITGIPFTDPYNLSFKCNISSNFKSTKELSSSFIYEMIEEYGGVKNFYNDYIISSICPYGFTKNGKNLNYYDDNDLFKNWKNNIIKSISDQLTGFGSKQVCIVIGKGKNQFFFELLNKEYKFFNEIIALPHPRWILQYRSKQKKTFIKQYVETLKKIKHE